MTQNAIDQRAKQGGALYVSLGNSAQLPTNYPQGIPAGLQVRLRTRGSFGDYLPPESWPALTTSGTVVTQNYTADLVAALSETQYQREYWWYRPGTTERRLYFAAEVIVNRETQKGGVTGEAITINQTTGAVEALSVWDVLIQDIVAQAQNLIDSRIYFISEVTNGIRLGFGPTAQVTEKSTQYGPAITITI